MATKELRNRVDDQWRQQASSWGQENHDRERKLIYDYLDQDENIVGLVGCTWGPISAFEEDAGFVLRQQRLKGAAVATDLSVYLVSHKGFSKLVTQMPLPSITAVEHANGIVTVAGDAIHNWAGRHKTTLSKSGMFTVAGAPASPNLCRGSRPRLPQPSLRPPPINTWE